MLARTCVIASFALWFGAVPALAERGSDAERLWFTLRPTSHEARWLIAEGQRELSTLRALVALVADTNAIVQVAVTPLDGTAGTTRFQTRAGGHCYMVITISAREDRVRQMVTLAHELVHVLEVVNAADVRSQADVRALYSRIGEPVANGRYESLAARRVSCLALEEALGRSHLVASADVARLIAR